MSEEKYLKIKENIKKVIVGKDEVIDLLMTTFLAGGHVLLEDMPGTGKTMLAKSLAKSICEESQHDDLMDSFSRVQFTPDLLPSDVTGLNIYHQKEGEFRFHKGPIFTHVLLADEINRATPRTQSSLLECMEEHQVTIDGETRRLADPFFVIATQNPIETAGTFPLPEAQLDRFFMRLSLGFTNGEAEVEVLQRFLKQNPYEELNAVCTLQDIVEMKQELEETYVHPEMISYIQNLCQATREDKDILVGVSTRGTLALLRGARAYAYIQNRKYVVPEDVKAVAVQILSHRLVMQGGFADRKQQEKKVAELLETVEVPTEEWSRS